MSTLHADQPSCTPTIPPASEERRSRAAAIAPCLRCGAEGEMHADRTILREARGVLVLRVLCVACHEAALDARPLFPVPEDFPAAHPGEKHGTEYLAAIQAHLDHGQERWRRDEELMEAHWDDRVLPAMRAMLAAAEVA